MEEYEGHTDYGIKIEAYGRKVRRAMYMGLVAIVVVIGIGLLLRPAKAHEAPSGMKYDASCCHAIGLRGDCQPIPNASVKPIPGGYQITLGPGDHRLATRVHVFQIEESKTRRSTDGQYHACLYPTENDLRCFYAPPMGF